jgi:phospholipid/cholesterol/gamma-HCH transport system substrate-binding protein
MNKNIFETILGAVVLVVAALFIIFASKTAQITPSAGYEISAAFNKVDGLEAGSVIKIGGVKVGQVTKIELDPATYQAMVMMNINNDVKVPADTAAVISSAGLLDGKFLSLEPGGDEVMLEAGDRIEYTQSTPSLEQMLGQVIFALTKDDKKDEKPSQPAEMP